MPNRRSSSMISGACSAARSGYSRAVQRQEQVVLLQFLRGLPQQGSAAAVVRTIPTAEMYNGDFSNWRDANGNLIPIYDPATTRVNPNGPGHLRDAFPNNQIPLSRFSQISRNVIALATMRPESPGCAQQLHLHARRRNQYQPLEQVQHQARSQPVEQGPAWIPVPLGRGARHPAGGWPGRRTARAPQQLPRRGFEHARCTG